MAALAMRDICWLTLTLQEPFDLQEPFGFEEIQT